jgi:cold-inducible RNA-binding protein
LNFYSKGHGQNNLALNFKAAECDGLISSKTEISFRHRPLRVTGLDLFRKQSAKGSRPTRVQGLPILKGEGGGSKLPRHGEHLMPQKLFVGNLPHEVTDSELGEFVSSAGFQAASAVVIRDKTTGQSRGFGFIELAEGEDLERAIAGLNGQSLQGRRLTVNEARPPRNDFGGGGGGRRPGGGGGGRGRSGGGGGGGRGRDW